MRWTLPVRDQPFLKQGSNLKEALELFLETASDTEIEQRLHEEVYVTQVEVEIV